jgi:RNA polymerase sigma-70 factor (ECF subfamily)
LDDLQGPPESRATARRQAAFRDLFDGLREEQGEVLVLRIVLGWDLQEIANATGAPLNTVRSRLRLGKEALRRRLATDRALAEAFNARDWEG